MKLQKKASAACSLIGSLLMAGARGAAEGDAVIEPRAAEVLRSMSTYMSGLSQFTFSATNTPQLGRYLMYRRYRLLKLASVALAILVFATPASQLLKAAPQAQEQAGAGPYIVLLGAPGAGKATNAEHIGTEFGVPVLSAVTVLEREIRRATRYSNPAQKNAATRRMQRTRRALASLQAGELINDESLNAMAASRLSESDALGGFVIVAYPNTAEQAVFLDGYSESHNIDNLIVIFLDIPDDIALLRMRERGRAEYRQGFGQARLDLFRTEIAEVLAFYEGSVLTVDATKPQPEVDAAIDAFIRQSTQ